MANRSGMERAGYRVARQPPELMDARAAEGDEGEDGAGATERAGGSAWERMLEALGDDGAGGLEDGVESLQASIAERLRTRAGALVAAGTRAAPQRSVRRWRR